MLQSTQIQRRQSEIRQSLAELAAKSDPTEDETRQMETLDGEYRRNETRYRAALIAEDEERREAGADLETRAGSEWAGLVGQFELRQAVLHLDEGRELSGPTAEVVAELRSRGGFRGTPIPYEALEQRTGETVSTAVPAPVQTRPIIDRLFPQSVASRLGVASINIPQGEIEFPVATHGATFGWATSEIGNVGAATQFKTAEKTLKPDHTGGAQMIISRKALAQAGTGLEAAIRRDLSAAIAAEIDRIVINGSGASGEPLGIISGYSTYGISSTGAAGADWPAIRDEIVAFMQANAISTAGGVNLAITPAIWAELDDALLYGTAVSEWDRLTKHVSNPAVSNVIPSETAILTATVQGIAPGYLGLWGGIDLIRDVYTKAASGQLVLTGLVTADFTVPRGLQTRIVTGLTNGTDTGTTG